MSMHVFTLAALGLAAGLVGEQGQRIEGIVVNGTRGGVPVPAAEVVLRAGEDGALIPVAKTTTDQDGHFVFVDAPTRPGLIYLPGANLQDVHYPGPRFHLEAGGPPARLKLTVFEGIQSPSPLIAERHDIDMELKPGVMAITETLVIDNPTRTTYVGKGDSTTSLRTLSLSIPEGFERVTFDKEFHGRNFKLADGCLVTDIPWPPGKRELRFTYHLPVEDSQQTLEWALHIPSSLVRIRVRGENADQVVCNLPQVVSNTVPVVFESSGKRLEAGHVIKLQLSRLSAPWMLSARWAALVVLGGLIFVTAALVTLRRSWRKRQRAKRDSRHSSGGRRTIRPKAGYYRQRRSPAKHS
jgi:hypothetical protein